MDSAAIVYWTKPDLALTVDYGQLAAEGEVRAAKAICAETSTPHEVITANTRHLGGGTMAGTGVLSEAAPEWWPFRNQLLLTLAAMRMGAASGEILIGTVASDKVHSDGRAEFLRSFNGLLAAQEANITVIAPAIELSSVELIEKSLVPEGVLGWTLSCHTGPVGCGECRGCVKHVETRALLQQRGFF
jgi:7-cyano-7-deazaguanine synthase